MKRKIKEVAALTLISIFILSFPECKQDTDALVQDTDTLSVAPEPPVVWFVDGSRPDDSGDGLSWATARKSVQSAVNAAKAGEKVFVKEGNYSSGNTDPVVMMKPGVKIYGGFVGTESNVAERGNPADHSTILDGQMQSYHVVLGASHTRLDGFLVQYGYAFGPGDDSLGGGMFNYGVKDIKVRNCVFSKNYAYESGGGMINDTSNVSISNSVLSDNFCYFFGGGILNFNSTASIDNAIFAYNNAYYYYYTFPTIFKFDGRGGGVANSSSDVSVTNSYFYQNGAGISGGGIFNGGSNIEVYNNYFVNNYTYNLHKYDSGGGAVHNMATDGNISNNILEGNTSSSFSAVYSSGSSLTLSDNLFYANTQGAIYNFDCDSVMIENSVFGANSNNWNGGAVNNLASPTTIFNCIFSGNKSYGPDGGSAVYNVYAYIEIINSTFSGNTAYNTNVEGGAVHNYYYSDMVIYNSILWGNEASNGHDEIYSGGISTVAVTYSDVEMSPASVYTGAGNINDDPLFISGAGLGLANDFFLSQVATGDATQPVDSPCVDAGNDTAANIGLGDKTTRTDAVADEGIVDMGFHFPIP